MAKISATKKLVIEDYPTEVKKWIPRMIDPLNRFLEQVYGALVRGLTFRDNLKAQVIEVEIGEGVTETAVRYSLNERPTALVLGKLRTQNDESPTAAFSMSWQIYDDQIRITWLGLDANTKYRATLIAQV